MPIHDDEAPRLAEIGRRITEMGNTLTDFRSEMRANLRDLVPKEAYHAERDAMKERIYNLEQASRTTRGLVLSSVAAGLVSLIMLVLNVVIMKGGG